jgi:hypothetical protein
MKAVRALHCCVVSALALSIANAAEASVEPASHRYVIAIGYNGVPAASSTPLEPLRFADDDAIAFSSFASVGAQQVHLLSVIDPETQRRLGRTAPEMRPPSLDELRAAVAEVRAAIDSDARSGVESTVYLYYSGHGTDEPGRPPALALLDADLTRDVLYDDVLAALPATHVHLFVDACHAEAVVRPRDAQALVVPATEQDIAHYAVSGTLARFPSVGAIVAATRGAQTHEWDVYAGGVFTHELLSGLRGAADVDGNGRLEYSEVAAFLSAANGGVADPRAHLQPIVRAPVGNPRVPIVDLRARAEDVVLEGRADRHGLLSIEDEQGDRILDLRAETGYRTRLVVPASKTLFIRSELGEATLFAAPGARVALASLAFQEAPLVPRGALESALHHGLFATPFGRSYYQGFIDRATDMVAVPLPIEAPPDALADNASRSPTHGDPKRTYGWIAVGSAAAMTAAAGVFGFLALDAQSAFGSAPTERTSADASDRYTTDSAAFWTLAGCAVATSAVGVYLLVTSGHDAARASSKARLRPTALTFDF